MSDDYADEYIPDSAPQAVEEAPPQAEQANGRDYEGEARKQGWKPQDEFDGPADKWRPAKEFVDRGNEDPRILRSRVDKLDKLYEGVKKQWQADLSTKEKEFNARVERLNKVSELALQRQRESYEGQIATAKRQAAAEGDVERFDQIEQHEREVKKAWAADDAEVAKQPEQTRHDPRQAAPTPCAAPTGRGWRRSRWSGRNRPAPSAVRGHRARAKPESRAPS